MRLLLIDDSRLDRKTIKRLLAQTKTDASVAEASDVESALGMVAVEHFDCILIDYKLPGSDGVALAEQIAANHGGTTTPMVMLTADPSPALAEQALGSGLSDFMSKRNLSAEHLSQTLCNALIKHQAEKRRTAADEGDHAAQQLISEKNGLVMQALALLTSSEAMKQCLSDDEDVRNAMDLLHQATTLQLVH